jgi:hypothetical protein
MGNRGGPTLITLGPAGTCHERATREYMRFQGVEDFEISFIGDFFDGLEQIRGREDAFLVQCSAHPLVHKIIEKYWDEVFVVDTFIYPTKALALLSRRDVEKPRSLGLVLPLPDMSILNSGTKSSMSSRSRSSPKSSSPVVTTPD